MAGALAATVVPADRFKSGMQFLASTVAVISSCYEGKRSGMTATAVCSLSADPPSLIVCANRQTRTYGYIMDSRTFCVNLLSEQQLEIAKIFASSGDPDLDSKFRRIGTWTASPAGVPILEDCVANFICDVDKWINTKSHIAFVGIVKDVQLNDSLGPLLYGSRKFMKLAPIE